MERIDDLQTKGLRIVQDPELFCFSTDAVLLADFAHLRPHERVLDLGAGTGVLDLLMHAREPDAVFTALELQPELYVLLERNVALNDLDRFITPVLGDIKEVTVPAGRAFDVCVCNPPYEKVGHGEARRARTHDIARKELCITLAEICASAQRALRFGGRFYVCLPACRLAELMTELRSTGLEPKKLRLVHAAPGREARLCLVMAAKGGREGMRIGPPLFLRDEAGRETAELRKIYSRGQEPQPKP